MWQVDDVSFQPAQPRSAGACVQTPLLVLSEKTQGQLKLLRFLPIFIFFPFEKTVKFTRV